MTITTTHTAPTTLKQRGRGLEILMDTRTGLPAGIVTSRTGAIVPLATSIELESGGRDVPGTMSGLAHRDTDRHLADEFVPGSFEHVTAGPEETYVLESDAGDWRVRSRITFREEHPRVELRVAVSPTTPGKEHVLRDLHVRVELPVDRLGDWQVEAPGNTLRPGVALGDIAEEVSVVPAGDMLGSPGFVVVHDDERPLALFVWPLSQSESGPITLEPSEGKVCLHLQTLLAGAVQAGDWLEHGPIYLDVVELPWSDLRAEIRSWHESVGLSTPAEKPAWASAVNIFEVLVGSAPFHGGHEYCPYPTLQDLIDDLDRIAGLGFDCVQLMPRHPYPSYNIHEPGDVATTYGDPAQLRELVEGCHARGMRLILDILLHGVLDKASIARAVEVVKNGPHADRLDDPCSDPYTLESREISWSRHILAFEPYWSGGSPESHPLLEAHPEWFMRDSEGAVSGVYTNALDIANEEWQDHFIGTCEALVRDYDIDGFRVDAPLYNYFPNWSDATRRHASYSNLGAMRMLRKLRRRLRALSSDLLVYTEPSGALLRESLDLAYSYEEVWLIPSLFPEERGEERAWRRVRTGKELAAWCRDFDATLPAGSVSAHFLDCHDTMWWRLPGDWWRREQIGLEATKALLAVYALRGGGYMTFVGGEEGIESELRLAHRLRKVLPEVHDGAADYDAVSLDDDAVYAVLRRAGDRATLVAVNLSDSTVRATCAVEGPATRTDDRVFDAWSGEWLAPPTVSDGALRLDLTFDPYQARVVILKDPPDTLIG